MIKSHEAVVDIMVAKLSAHVAGLNARHPLVRLRIPNLQHERSDSVIIDLSVLIRDTEASEQKHVGGVVRHRARPPLGRIDRGRVNHELIGLHVEGRGRLQICYIGAVPELGLTVSDDDVEVVELLPPVFPLLIVRHRLHCFEAHHERVEERGLALE